MQDVYIKVSVIICTYNPRRDYLSRTLAALQAQTLPKSQWELLLVDNASREPVAESWDLSWHHSGRHVHEPNIGLTTARLRGISDAKGELLVFVDDDNVLDKRFLAQAVSIAENYPLVGVFGAGMLEAEFEIQPPPELVSRLHMLALRTVPTMRCSSDPFESDCIPWGAGLCVTREVAAEFCRLIGRLRVTEVLGRRGNQLFSGEDDIFAWASAMNGKEFGIFPELRITHLISAARLNQTYFLRLIENQTFSQCVMSYLLFGRVPHRVGFGEYIRMSLHLIRRGYFSMRCRMVEASGRTRAVRFIADRALRPLQITFKGIGKR